MKKLTKFLIVLVTATVMAGLSAAQQQPTGSQTEGQALHILVGKSVVVNVQTPITRVLSSNPAVIETLATSPTEIVVEGRTPGTSNLILWDQTGHSQMLDVIVDLDVSGLRTALQRAYPAQQIDVQADGGKVIVTGNVTDPKMADDLLKTVSLYSKDVVNFIKLEPGHDRQIMLEVRFAEVDRTKLQQFGINIFSTGAANTPGTISTQQFGPLSSAAVAGSIGQPIKGVTSSFNLPDLLNLFVFRPDLNLGATIKDLQQKTVLQILAEPNLMAINGQKATFLAGGEFPFPFVQPGNGFTAVTIQFKPFGVKLDFTANITGENIVRLHVAPEVSTLDFANGLSISGFTVPAISTRRAETELELKDGQSFGIAGLMDQRVQATMSKIPGIGDVPVLGQLFRSRSVNKANTELLVLVTPHIIDPVHVAPPLPTNVPQPIPFMDKPKFDDGLPGFKKKEEAPSNPSAK
jgi:pilus assembly protein CpaC